VSALLVAFLFHSIKAVVSLLVVSDDRLFKVEEPGKESGDFTADINTNSLTIVDNVMVEPAVAKNALTMMAKVRESQSSEAASSPINKLYYSDLTYQFERNGYFALDSSSTEKNLIFNRIVMLRDTWGGAPRRAPKSKAKKSN